MSVFDGSELGLARAIGLLPFENPFLPERIELEQRILGDAYVPIQKTWSADPTVLKDNPNVSGIRDLADKLALRARQALARGVVPVEGELQVYENLVLYVLYYRFEDLMYRDIVATTGSRGRRRRVAYYDDFKRDVTFFFDVTFISRRKRPPVEHLFALFFQHRRAFHFTFRRIFGGSMAVSRLRAAVWESIFTCNMRRYWTSLFGRMNDLATLITGPSGTGKELVASAIGLSRYIPFDASTGCFTVDFRKTFHPLNLSALAPNLVESELFGHTKGAFTGAVSDRAGYLDGKDATHTVFLDEIGDVNTAIQVKLLRVLQTREFQSLGDPHYRHFAGKIVAATNQDLSSSISSGNFRVDLYYRLCADHIQTPSLAEQIAGDPAELRSLVRLISHGIFGSEDSDELIDQVNGWIERNLGLDYPWPGNIRELEQCIRNIVVHGAYHPIAIADRRSAPERMARDFVRGTMTADQMLERYCTLVFAKTGQYQEAGRLLGLDRRTVKARINETLLREIEDEG